MATSTLNKQQFELNDFNSIRRFNRIVDRYGQRDNTKEKITDNTMNSLVRTKELLKSVILRSKS